MSVGRTGYVLDERVGGDDGSVCFLDRVAFVAV
jgi:hypothetical protein